MSQHHRQVKRQAALQLIDELRESYHRSGSPSLLLDFLGDSKDEDNRQIRSLFFWEALASADWELAKQLVAAGYPIAATASGDFGPLHDLISKKMDRVDIVKWLVGNGAKIEQRGIWDDTPLIAACGAGLSKIVEALIELGADLTARTEVDKYETPLMRAAASGNADVTRIILDHATPHMLAGDWANEAVSFAERHHQHETAEIIRVAIAQRHKKRRNRNNRGKRS